MHGLRSAFFFLLLFSPLFAQEPSPAPPSPALNSSAAVQTSETPGPAFQFTKVDLGFLLSEANAADAQFEQKSASVLHDPGNPAPI